MSSASVSADGGSRATHPVRENWGWFLVLGIVFVLCGTAAIMLPLLSTLAASLVIGIVVAVGGAGQIIHAFRAKGWSGFVWNLLVGIIALVGGFLIWMNPFAGAVAITLVIACVFLAQGVGQIGLALRVRPHDGWGWMLLSGLVALVAGIWLLMRFAVAGLFAPGLIVGVALLFEGWAFIAIALTARRRNA